MNERAMKLLDAACEAYDLFHVSSEGKSFCNFSVHHICGRMGYVKLKGMLANQIVDFLQRAPEWELVGMPEAQNLANEGRLVIAGKQEEPHGHVVVVRPGLEEFSGKWQMRTPKVANVGRTSYIGKSLAWAFKEVPELWVLDDF